MKFEDFLNPGKGKKKPRDMNDLSRWTIENDKWDREDVQKLLKKMPEFAAYREKLIKSRAGDLAYDIWMDAYESLWKVRPENVPDNDIRPTHIVNRMVRDEMIKLPDHRELRQWTQGDDIGAALACNTIEPDLETIYDKLEEEKKKSEELQQKLQELVDLLQEQRSVEDMLRDAQEAAAQETDENGQPRELTDEEKQAIQDLLDNLDKIKQEIEEGKEGIDGIIIEIMQGLEGKRGDVRIALTHGMKEALEQAQGMSALGAAWGMEAGQLHRLPAAKRLELAKKLNDPRFKRFAELIGPIRRYAMAQQARKIHYIPEEIYDVELGNELARVLPSVRAMVMHPLRKLVFYKDYVQRNLLQYAMRGEEKVAKGGIVYCHDGSGSMHGDKEMWAKAVGLALLHIAMKQNRPFVAIQFGSPGEIRIDDFRKKEDITPEKVIDFAEFFFGGGTSFDSPLNAAVKILNEEFEKNGALKSDIVFATDGICGVSDSWFDNFKKEQVRLNFKVWGVMIGGSPTAEPMAKICDGEVSTIGSIMNGEGMGKIFGKL